ncbi:MAG: hypothetical protein ACOC1O_00695 [bacterium]
METIYRKKENGRYEAIGFNMPDLREGIWLVEKSKNVTSSTNLEVYKLDLPQPLDLSILASILQHKDVINKALLNLNEKEAKLINTSVDDFSSELIKEIYKIFESKK